MSFEKHLRGSNLNAVSFLYVAGSNLLIFYLVLFYVYVH